MHTNKRMNKKAILLMALYSSTVIGVAGSIVGTYAWYSYSNLNTVLFEGTTARVSTNLHIGLVSESQINAFHQVEDQPYAFEDLVEEDLETIPGKYVYWATSSILTPDIFQEYAKSLGNTSEILDEDGEVIGYANSLHPVTSGSFLNDEEDDTNVYASRHAIDFYQAPAYSAHNKDFLSLETFNNDADKAKDLVNLNFIFKVTDEEGEIINDKNYGIELNDFDIDILTDENLGNAFRAHIVDPSKDAEDPALNENFGFIFNPAEDNDGYDEVGGILNLDTDNFYDFNRNMREIIYGEVIDQDGNEIAIASNGVATAEQQAIFWSATPNASNSNEFPIIGEGTEEDPEFPITTFDANHRKSVKNAQNYQAKRAYYYGKDTVLGEEVCSTGELVNGFNKGYACVNFTIYIEGWDKAVIDQNADAIFNLALEFESAEKVA